MGVQLDLGIVAAIYISAGAMIVYTFRRINLLAEWIFRGQSMPTIVRWSIFAGLVSVAIFSVWGFGALLIALPISQGIVALASCLIAMFLSTLGIWLSGRLSKQKTDTPLSDGLRAAPAKMVAARARLSANRINARANIIEDERRRLSDQIKLASRVQADVMRQSQAVPHIKTAHWLEAADEVSGDMLYTWQGGGVNGKAFNMFLGDASGHGLSAGLMSLVANTGIRGMDPDSELSAIMHHLNKLLLTNSTEMFVTGLLVRIDTDGALSAVNCGHPPLIIVQSEGLPVLLTNSGLPLGMFGAEFEVECEETYELHHGDRVFAATDGLYETSLRDKDEFVFGVQETANFVADHRHENVEGLIDHIKQLLVAFQTQKNASDADDVLITLAEYCDVRCAVPTTDEAGITHSQGGDSADGLKQA